MRRHIDSPQRHMRILAYALTMGASPTLAEGSTDGTVARTGTGDYTITYKEPFARVPVATAASLTSSTILQISAITATSIRVKAFAVDGTTAKDAVVHLHVMGADVADAI